MRAWLPTLAWDRPISVLMAFVAAVVVGLVAWWRIPVQMMPSGFEPSFLWVWVSWPDATPTETDEAVVRPVLGQLRTVPGIKRLESEAESGSASFAIEFWSSVDMDEAYNGVVDRLERAMTELPSDVRRYGVWRYNPADEPVVWAGVSFPETVDDPYHVMTKIVQPRLERIPGVAALDIWGVGQRALEIHYDRERTMSHGVDLGELQRRLASDNLQISGGRVVDDGRVVHVRSIARLSGPEELARYPVKEGVALTDIADVGFLERRSGTISRIDGRPGAAFGVRKESTANTVEVAAAVEAAIDELEADPRVGGARFFTFFNQGDLITESIDNLSFSALTGGVFAVLILWLFLREWRMTLLIAASIPFSLLITVAILYFRGDSLNLISLMGLMLAVGMVVDNAIVVVETIYGRRAAGAAPRAAAIGGTAEVNLAIVLSTATTMVVFLPVILMSENATFSFFMGVLGLPVVFALGASLVVALVFAPVATGLVRTASITPDARWLSWLTRRYGDGLAWILRHRVDGALIALGLFVLTVQVPYQRVEAADSNSNLNDFTVRFTVPAQASLRERDEIVKRFEALVEENRERWGVRVYRARLESDSFRGRLNVYLDPDAGGMPREEVLEDAKDKLPRDIPGVVPAIGWEGGGGGGQPNRVTLSVWGEDMATLRGLGEEIVRRTEGLPGVLSADLAYASGGTDEMRFYVDRDQAGRFGLSPQSVGQTLAWAMRANPLPSLWVGEREIEVASRFSLEDRSNVEALRDFGLWSPTTRQLVPVRAVTSVEVGRGPGDIHRTDGRTAVEVSVDLHEDVDAMQAFGDVEAALSDMVLPRGYGWTKGDAFDEREENDAAAALALLLSATFVFLLMGVLFESLLLPLCIITTLPMAMLGAYWGLYLTGTPMDLMARIGVVILVGVVVNNGIVLIDLVSHLRAQGMPRDEALVESGRRRIRPILMTALTTICGLLPMALGDSTFVGMPYAPLGRTVMSGMMVGTVLTLFLVPWLYALLDDLRGAASGWARFARGGAAAAVALFALDAHAQTPVTYDEVLAGALRQNPALVRAGLAVDESEAGVLGARSAFDPAFTLDGTWRRSTQKGFFQGFPFDARTRAWDLGSGFRATLPTGTTWAVDLDMDRNLSNYKNEFGGIEGEFVQDAYTANGSFSITQQLLEGHRLAYNLRNVTRAREGLAVAEVSLERTRQETLAAASRGYWEWSYRAKLLDIANGSVEVAAEALRVGSLSVETGKLAPVERTRLEAALVQAQTAALDAELALDKARDDVLLLMGEAPGRDVTPSTPAKDPVPHDIEPAAAVEVALAQNLDLALARAQVAAAEAQHRDARHMLLPSLSATVASGRGAQVTSEDEETSLGAAVGGLFTDDAFPYVSVGGNLSVPIGNRAARGEVGRTGARVATERISLEEAERGVAAQVEQQVLAMASARRKVELAAVNARLAEETLAAEEALFGSGRAILKDVLEARSGLDRARAEAAKARTDWQVAVVELQRLQGQLEAP